MAKSRLLSPKDYLEKREQEIFNAIWSIALNGRSEDNVRLKALTSLYNKLRPDRTKVEIDAKATAPYDLLLRNLGKGKAKKPVG